MFAHIAILLMQTEKEGGEIMKQPQIRSIIPHFVQDENGETLSGGIAGLHAQVIENRLSQLNLTTKQKLTVLDQIIANLRANKASFSSKNNFVTLTETEGNVRYKGRKYL
jgi:hypothetical protein